MSVGQQFDDAARLLQQAADAMASLAPDRYDLAATITGRDQFYRELTRFLDTLRIQPAAQPANLEAALSLLNDAATGTALAASLRAATLGLPAVARELLLARPNPAPLMIQACDAIGIASEIVATHLPPSPPRYDSPTGTPYLTHEGAALMRGAQRVELLGEMSRLAAVAVRVDEKLLLWGRNHPDVADPQHRKHLGQWTRSGPRLLASLVQAPPAQLLRQLQPAPPVERPTGPRDISTWPDAIHAATAIRSAIRRDPHLGTVGVARAAARLGFALTAAAWKLTGTTEPAQALAMHGSRWRELASVLDSVADARAGIAAPLVDELDYTMVWLRAQLVGRTDPATPTELQATRELYHHIRLLCAELQQPLALARDRGDLLEPTGKALGPDRIRGIVLAMPTWSRASRSNPQATRVIQELGLAAALPDIPQRTDAEPEANTCGPSVAKAFTGPVGGVLHDRSGFTAASNRAPVTHQPTLQEHTQR